MGDLDLVAPSLKGSRPACVVIAHRGASAYCPENTIPAFEAAIELGAHMIELDVQLSRDGEVVVVHDETLARCSDGRGKVAGQSLAELKRLDAGSWFGKDFEGTRIPTLEEVLSLCRGRIAVNVEIKTEAVTDRVIGGIEEKCLDLVATRGMGNQVVFSSFDPRALQHLRLMDTGAAIAVLYDKKVYPSKLPSEITSFLKADYFNCSWRELGRNWCADLNENRISTNIYTVNDTLTMRRLLEAGVDGIFTNRPDVLWRVVDDFRRHMKQSGQEQ